MSQLFESQLYCSACNQPLVLIEPGVWHCRAGRGAHDDFEESAPYVIINMGKSTPLHVALDLATVERSARRAYGEMVLMRKDWTLPEVSPPPDLETVLLNYEWHGPDGQTVTVFISGYYDEVKNEWVVWSIDETAADVPNDDAPMGVVLPYNTPRIKGWRSIS